MPFRLVRVKEHDATHMPPTSRIVAWIEATCDRGHACRSLMSRGDGRMSAIL